MHQLTQKVLESLRLLGHVSLISVVLVVEALVPLGGVTSHLVQPPQIGIILNHIYYKVNWFLKHRIHYFSYLPWWQVEEISPRPRRHISIYFGVLPIMDNFFCFSLILNLIILQPLELLNFYISPIRFLVRDFLNSKPIERPTLNVLAATFS